MGLCIVQKDITTVTEGVVVHGVNCSGIAMNSGVAKAIRNKWPSIYDVYVSSGSGPEMLGEIVPHQINDSLWVINGYTQVNYGRDGAVYADKRAVLKVVEKSILFAKERELKLYSPKIGCGLGGLMWGEVLEILQRLSALYDHEVVACEYFE